MFEPARNRARSESEICHLVRVCIDGRHAPTRPQLALWTPSPAYWGGLRKRRRVLRGVAECVDAAQIRQFGDGAENVGAVRVGAVARLREQGGGARARQQLDDFGNGVIAVQ